MPESDDFIGDPEFTEPSGLLTLSSEADPTRGTRAKDGSAEPGASEFRGRHQCLGHQDAPCAATYLLTAPSTVGKKACSPSGE